MHLRLSHEISLFLEIYELDFVLAVPEPLVDAFEVEIDFLGKLLDLATLPLTRLSVGEEFLHLTDLLLRLALQLKAFA